MYKIISKYSQLSKKIKKVEEQEKEVKELKINITKCNYKITRSCKNKILVKYLTFLNLQD